MSPPTFLEVGTKRVRSHLSFTTGCLCFTRFVTLTILMADVLVHRQAIQKTATSDGALPGNNRHNRELIVLTQAS